MRTARLLLAFAALALACEPGADGDAPALNEGAVKTAFETAAIESGVPQDLLLAVGWYESRWVHVAAEVDTDHGPGEIPGEGPQHDGHSGAVGIMQLSSREGHDTLGLACELTEQPRELLETDVAWNIRGGAAVLRRYADELYDGLDIEQLDLFSWRDVLARWSGLEDPSDAYAVADEIFAILRDGAGRTLESGEALELFPNAGLGTPEENVAPGGGDIVTDESGLGMAGVPFSSAYSGNFTRGRDGKSVKYVIIHTMQGSYAGSMAWFRNPAAKASAHYCLRSRDGATTQTVDENDTGWHAGNWSYNQQSVGIEHEGFVNDPEWYTDAMYRASARLVCDLARRHQIPIDRQHILGHVEVPGATHTDPGRHWDWNYYMGLVRQCGGGTAPTPGPADNPAQGGNGSSTVTPGQGTLQGFVYAEGDTSRRLAGAQVRLSNGLTLTTNSVGYWTLKVAAGTYTATATKDGYRAASVSRSVQSGGSSWASTSLTRGAVAAVPGHISGVVYEGGDSSRRLAGVTLSVNGRTATTDANGRYTVEAAAGRRDVDFTAPGFLSKTLGIEVRAGQTASLNAGMQRRAAKAQVVGVVYQSPDSSKRIAGARVTATNGRQTLTRTADGTGYFEFNDVDAGSWRVTASASGHAAGSRSVNALGAAKNWGSVGLARIATGAGSGRLLGVIYESPNTSKRLPGARVTLSSGVTVVADANGVYEVAASGTVTIVASAPGFSSRAISRTMTSGAQTWGSIGLTRGTPGSASSSQLVCTASSPRLPHDVRIDIELRSPRLNELVDSRPTFDFRSLGDGTASWVVVILPVGQDESKAIEFKVSPGEDHREQPPRVLAADTYSWSVYPIWNDCARGEPMDWAFFTVK